MKHLFSGHRSEIPEMKIHDPWDENPGSPVQKSRIPISISSFPGKFKNHKKNLQKILKILIQNL